MAKDPSFYQKMLEAKRLKKQRLEQEQLAAEFQAYPERFVEPVIVKTEAEVKMDAAFSQLKDKLHREHPTQQDKIQQALDRLQGL